MDSDTITTTTTTTTTTNPSSPKTKKYNHLIILQHGLHGTFEDFTTIKNHFIKQNHDNCIFIAAKSNSYFLATHDGIDNIGKRLYQEIKELYEQYGQPEKISLIGHSLGGLITRYAIGLLYQNGFFEKCKPDQFISLSSPHCGSRRPSTTMFNKVAHIFVDTFLSVTGKQLILTDQPIETNTNKNITTTTTTTTTTKDIDIVTNDNQVPLPLLVKMTEGIFFEGLKLFRKRILYSNIYNDIQVNFCTSDISPKNPYTLGKAMKFTEKYKHIIQEEETILDIDPELLEDQINQTDSTTDSDSTNKIDDYFTHDTHHLYLKRILRNLRKLEFTRYHMHFNNFLSHTNIVVKRGWINSDGWDIVNHLIDHFDY